MPVLKQIVLEVKQFFLPSTANLPQEEQAWVKMNVGEASAADLMALSDNGATDGVTAMLMVQRIKEWNFNDEKGEVLPINVETVGWLDPGDFSYLFKLLNRVGTKATGLSTDQKKS